MGDNDTWCHASPDRKSHHGTTRPIALHLRVFLNQLSQKHQGDEGWPLSRQTPPCPSSIMGICEEQPGIYPKHTCTPFIPTPVVVPPIASVHDQSTCSRHQEQHTWLMISAVSTGDKSVSKNLSRIPNNSFNITNFQVSFSKVTCGIFIDLMSTSSILDTFISLHKLRQFRPKTDL